MSKVTLKVVEMLNSWFLAFRTFEIVKTDYQTFELQIGLNAKIQ